MNGKSGLFRVGIVGYGYSGRTFHAPLIIATPGLFLTAVASRDAAKVRADLPNVAVFDDPMSLVAASDIDLVVIASPNDSHVPLARAALEARKNVVVDKPFTLDLADARELVALAARHGRLLSVFQNRRWDSDYLSVKRAIADGLLGKVTHFESHFDRFRPEVRRRWRESAGPGSGIWFDLGPHLVDQYLQLFGLPDRLQANLAMQRDGALADDWAHVVLDAGVCRVILHAGMLAAGGSNRFLLHGHKGSLVKRKADRQEAQLLAGMKPGSAGWGTDLDDMLFYDGSGAERRITAASGDQRRYYIGIDAALRNLGQNPVPPLQAIAVVAVIEAAALSARSGKSVELDLTQEERAAWK
jgi:predicted dehydrogenase